MDESQTRVLPDEDAGATPILGGQPVPAKRSARDTMLLDLYQLALEDRSYAMLVFMAIVAGVVVGIVV